MIVPSARYVTAIVVNVALPALAYKLAIGHVGVMGALMASALPLIVWMTFDLTRHRHFDALSGIVLAGIVMSLLVLVSGADGWLRNSREPAVSGAIGVFFLLSLFLERPLVYYLARSTLSREQQGREADFDSRWASRPALVRSIRLMTAVWGIGLVGENLARLWITLHLPGADASRLSTYVSYATYAGLTLWTMIYRNRYIKRQQ